MSEITFLHILTSTLDAATTRIRVLLMFPMSDILSEVIKHRQFNSLPRHTWSLVNRLRTGQSPCRAKLHKWGHAQSPSCDCGQRQTMNHIVDTYPLAKFEGGLNHTPRSGWWRSHMAGIYSDCSTREINKFNSYSQRGSRNAVAWFLPFLRCVGLMPQRHHLCACKRQLCHINVPYIIVVAVAWLHLLRHPAWKKRATVLSRRQAAIASYCQWETHNNVHK